MRAEMMPNPNEPQGRPRTKTIHGSEARQQLFAGVQELAKTVKSTLGPNGRNVIIGVNEAGTPAFTKDGVTVANSINFPDTWMAMGANSVREVSQKTADVAGDGTTTATVLVESILKLGLPLVDNVEVNPIQLRRGIDAVVTEITDVLDEQCTKVDTFDQIKQTATISTNGDTELGTLIAEAIDSVGIDGFVSVEKSKSLETTLERIQGIELTDCGVISPVLLPPGTMKVELENVSVFMYDGKLTQANQVMDVMGKIWKHNQELAVGATPKSLLIVAEELTGDALATIHHNLMSGVINVSVIKAPSYGSQKTSSMADLGVLTGATVVSQEGSIPLDDFPMDLLGTADKVTITSGKSVFVGCVPNQEDLDARIIALKEDIENEEVPYMKGKLKKRLSRLVGGVAIIHIGGSTEADVREKADRIDDALHATRAAIEEGVVSGGGVALIRAMQKVQADKSYVKVNDDQDTGRNIIFEAALAPLRTIASNAGHNADEIIETVLSADEEIGFDMISCDLVNMVESGIIDPVKVTKTALRNASSIAGLMLTTSSAIGAWR